MSKLTGNKSSTCKFFVLIANSFFQLCQFNIINNSHNSIIECSQFVYVYSVNFHFICKYVQKYIAKLLLLAGIVPQYHSK